MRKEILFLQGAGEGAYAEDKLLAESLRRALGSEYEVLYPLMPNEADAPYELWKRQIKKKIDDMIEPIILVGHSMGASYLAKILTEIEVKKLVAGIFLLETSFWGGDGWRYEGYEELEIPDGATERLPKGASIFLYHARDDEVVPFEHLTLYAKLLPQAVVREIDKGGHQLNNNLLLVAKDIKSLSL